MRKAIPLFLMSVMLAVGFLVGAQGDVVRGHSELSGGSMLTMMPAPDETLFYDDNVFDSLRVADDSSRYWATRFTPNVGPDTLCSLVVALVAIDTQGAPPICTLFVWDAAPGLPYLPVSPPARWQTFATASFPTWNSLTLTVPYVDSNDFWIGYFLENQGVDPKEQDTPVVDKTPPFLNERSWVSANRTTWFPVPSRFMGYGDLAIRAVVRYFGLVRDVSPILLLSPGDTVYCDSSVSVQARVENFGGSSESFDVYCEIDSAGLMVFSDTKTVIALAPGGTQDITFTPNWVVPRSDGRNYDIMVATLLVGDGSPQNDTLAEVTTGRCLARDVGPVALVNPSDSVYCDSSYALEVWVENFGDQTENFNVYIEIDSMGAMVYSNLQGVSGLTPGNTTPVVFSPNWQVPPKDGMDYDITAITLLGSDQVRSNDTLVDVTHARRAVHDVGPILLLAPGDTVYCDSSYTVQARVQNFGQQPENFNVSCRIDTVGGNVYTDTRAVSSLAPGATQDVSFIPDWVAPPRDAIDYTISIVTLLGGDVGPQNDTLAETTHGLCAMHDGGMVSLDSPDSAQVGSFYTPLATVHNYGNRTETFDLVCTIDGYTDTSGVSALPPDSSRQISFADWTVPAVGPYTMCVRAYVVGDMNTANDSLCKSIEATGVEETRHFSSVPTRTQIFQNTPNPFSRFTSIEYAISEGARVELLVYDSSGRLVKVLLRESKSPGYYTQTWDGRDENGNTMSSGIYFCKLVSGKTIHSTKMALVR
jgi:hypothetical protein